MQYVDKAVIEETFAAQVPTGYLVPCAGGYRPTIYGACIMTWQELWPFKALRKMSRKTAAERLLRELGQSRPVPAW